jgi:hypothetical protein
MSIFVPPLIENCPDSATKLNKPLISSRYQGLACFVVAIIVLNLILWLIIDGARKLTPEMILIIQAIADLMFKFTFGFALLSQRELIHMLGDIRKELDW